MANVYNLEPQPTAKVVLQTTAGDLSLELFAKQTPLASRNFLQHCLDGYYDNTIFHRLVPGFIVQGGDPTGSGSGGISAINNGDAFQDEFHSRLKFNRRGLLGMANEGADNNGSQFFLTLGVTPELQGKNTMFGRIEGDTIYNLMKMGDAELAEGANSERPLYPTRVIGAEILVNPFEDMIARAREAPRTRTEDNKSSKKRRKPAGKNVLSFGVGDEEEGAPLPVLKKAKVNPRLVAADTTQDKIRGSEKSVREEIKQAGPQTTANSKPATDPPVQLNTPPSNLHPHVSESEGRTTGKEQEDITGHGEDDESVNDADFDLANTSKRQQKLEKTNAEFAAIKASMKRDYEPKTQVPAKPVSALEAMIPVTSTRGRKRGKASDENGAIDMFKAFKQRLEDLPSAPSQPNGGISAQPKADAVSSDVKKAKDDVTAPANDEEATLCDLHFIANCQSCQSWDQDEDQGGKGALGEAKDDNEDDGTTWMTHTLTFAKDTLGKDLEWKRKMAEIEIIDPREKARSIKEQRRNERQRSKYDRSR